MDSKNDKLKSKKKGKKFDPLEELKLEIAAELGLLDKVKAVGWAGLSAKETGRIGGLMTKRMRSDK
ncbi:MAG: small, acid-soluble spore protein, alpha/beta type [Zhaonellaceae bacterium]